MYNEVDCLINYLINDLIKMGLTLDMKYINLHLLGLQTKLYRNRFAVSTQSYRSRYEAQRLPLVRVFHDVIMFITS